MTKVEEDRILALLDDIEAELDVADTDMIDSYDAVVTIREIVHTRRTLNELTEG